MIPKEKFSNRCFLCAKEMQERHLIESLETLEKHPDHVGPQYTHYFCVCTECLQKGDYNEQVDL